MPSERPAEYIDGVRAQRCSFCKEVKHLDQFNNDPSKKLGRRTTCFPCNKERGRLWRQKNSAYDKMKKREWWKAHKDEKRMQAWKQYVIDITVDRYKGLLVEQQNRCKICGIDGTGLKKALAPDHDHKTGVVRGLLCCNCNQGLGRFHDSPTKLAAAIAYLEASQCRAR